MDKQTRGDRYWDKKNPAATLILATKVQALVHQTQQFGDTPPLGEGATEEDGEAQLDDEIASAEKQAKQLMDRMQRSEGKAAFNARVHGKTR